MAGANRIRFVDIARGIAMICVIIGHMGIDQIDRVVYTFHVPIFFLIAGYFLKEDSRLWNLIKRKARTLLLPYAVTCLAVIVSGALYGGLHGKALAEAVKWIKASLYGSGAYYEKPFIIYAIGSTWFLWALFWASIFLCIILKCNQWLRPLLVLALFLLGYASKNLMWLPCSVQSGACATLFTYMGYLYRKGEDSVKKLPKEVLFFGSIMAVITWIFFVRDYQKFWLVCNNYGRGIVDVFSSVCACIVVLLISGYIDGKLKLTPKVLAFLGRYSLLVLCIHNVEANVFPWWQFVKRLFGPELNGDLHIFLMRFFRLICIFLGTWILSMIKPVRAIFGYEKTR